MCIKQAENIPYAHLICLTKTRCESCDDFMPCHSKVDLEKDIFEYDESKLNDRW